jgi:IS5 family transposase
MDSRTGALAHRCTNLSTALSNLASVVDVLRKRNYRYLENAQIADVRAESDFVWKAVLDLERGEVEVARMLDEIEGQRCEENLKDREVWKEETIRGWRVKGGDGGLWRTHNCARDILTSSTRLH